MKKKLLLILAIAASCSLMNFSDASAITTVSSCTFLSSSAAKTPEKLCAGSLYRTMSSNMRTYCKITTVTGQVDAANVSSCDNYVKGKIICSVTGMTSCPNESGKSGYYSTVRSMLRSGKNLDPCASSVNTPGYDSCVKTSENWPYYYASDPNKVTTPTPTGGNTPGDDGGSDDGSNTPGVNPGNQVNTEVSSGSCTSILPDSWCNNSNGINEIVSFVISILTGAVVVAGTIGIVICGFMWMSARDNEGQVATAKRRILDIVIGIIAWVLLAWLANLFIPKKTDNIETDANISMSRRK